MREMYIIFSICCGKQCLRLFRSPVVLDILYTTLLMLLSHFKLLFIVIPKMFKLSTYSVK